MFTPFAFVQTIASGGGGDADAAAYLAQVTAVGGTVDATITLAVNTLFTSLKTNSLYTEVKAMYPIVGGTADAHFIEGKQPTSANLTIGWTGSAAIHNSNGITVSGSSVGYGHINTAFNALFSGAGNVGLGAYQRTLTNTTGFLISKVANAVSAPRLQLNAPYDGVNYFAVAGSNVFAEFNNTSPLGFIFGTRRSATDMEFYLNGTSQVTQAGSVTLSLPTETIELFGADGNNNKCITNTNFFIFTNALNDTQVSTLNSIISTFETSLSRNY